MNFCWYCMRDAQGESVCPHCGRDDTEPVPAFCLEPGSVLQGRYLLGRCIQHTKYGTLYRALDQKLDLPVAVKTTPPTPETAVFRERPKADDEMFSEGDLFARWTERPCVPAILDRFEELGTTFLVLSELSGTPLDQLLAEKRIFSPDEVFSMMRPLLKTVSGFHNSEFVYAAFRPENLMLFDNGTLKLIGFRTDMHSPYAAPEQLSGKAPAGPWTDIYSLCAVIWSCITGILLTDDSQAVPGADGWKWPEDLGIAMSERQSQALRKGLATTAADRFQSVYEMLDYLEKGGSMSSLDDNPTVYIPRQSTTGGTEDLPTVFEPRQKSPSNGDEPLTVFSPRSASVNSSSGHKTAMNADISQAAAHESTRASEETGRSEGKRRPSSLRSAVTILCIIVFGVVGSLIYLRTRDSTSSQDSHVSSSGSQTKSADSSVFSSPNCHVMTMKPADNLSEADLQTVRSALEDRLNLLFGTDQYELRQDPDLFTLAVPKETFHDIDDKIFALYCCCTGTFGAVHNGAEVDENSQFMFDRSDFSSVTAQSGPLKMATAEDLDLDELPETWIQVVLTDECAQRHGSEIHAWGSELSFCPDLDLTNAYPNAFLTVPEGDGRTFDLLLSDERFVPLLIWNMTHDPLPCSLTTGYSTENIKWDEPRDGFKWQCNGKNISENYVIFRVSETDLMSKEVVWTKGQRVDIASALCERLDTLEQSWAIGYKEDDFSSIWIKTTLDHMSPEIMNIVSAESGNYQLQDNNSFLSVSSDYSLVWGSHTAELKHRVQEEPDSSDYAFPLPSPGKDKVDPFISALKSSENVLLSYGDMSPILFGSLHEVSGSRTIVFDRSALSGEKWNEQEDWYWALLNAVETGTEQAHALSAEEVEISGSSGYGINYVQLGKEQNSLVSSVQSVCSDATVQFSKHNANIKLHLAYDDSIIRNMNATLNSIKNWFFSSVAIRTVNILLVDGSFVPPNGRATIFLEKEDIDDYYEDTNSYPPGIVRGYLYNGLFEEYESPLNELLYNGVLFSGWHNYIEIGHAVLIRNCKWI